MKSNNILLTSLILGIISALLSAGIFYVNDITKDTIATSESRQLNGYYKEIFPDCEFEILYSKDKQGDKEEKILTVASATKGGTLQGYLYLVSSTGYSSQVVSLVGIDQGKAAIVQVIVTKQGETPGLGTNSTKPDFLDQFKNKATSEELKAKSNINAISGATITSSAVASDVNAAFSDFNNNYKK